MSRTLTIVIDAGGRGNEIPRRRDAGTAAPVPFAQQIAAFYPYPNPQEPAPRSAPETEPQRRGPAATARTAGLARRRTGREPD